MFSITLLGNHSGLVAEHVLGCPPGPYALCCCRVAGETDQQRGGVEDGEGGAAPSASAREQIGASGGKEVGGVPCQVLLFTRQGSDSRCGAWVMAAVFSESPGMRYYGG